MGEPDNPLKSSAVETSIPLDRARLSIGDTVQLHLKGDDAAERYQVQLIGMSKGRSVIVSTPLVDGRWLLMRDGTPLVFRAFSGRSAFAFTTQILKSANTPYPHLHLSYPREVRSLAVREDARCNVEIICAIAGGGDVPLNTSGTILDLSISGARVKCRAHPGEKGRPLVLKFRIPINEVDTLIEVAGTIRSIEVGRAGPDDPAIVGIQFDPSATKNMLGLHAYVYHRLLERSLGG